MDKRWATSILGIHQVHLPLYVYALNANIHQILALPTSFHFLPTELITVFFLSLCPLMDNIDPEKKNITFLFMKGVLTCYVYNQFRINDYFQRNIRVSLMHLWIMFTVTPIPSDLSFSPISPISRKEPQRFEAAFTHVSTSNPLEKCRLR